jgi:hypothetical protein
VRQLELELNLPGSICFLGYPCDNKKWQALSQTISLRSRNGLRCTVEDSTPAYDSAKVYLFLFPCCKIVCTALTLRLASFLRTFCRRQGSTAGRHHNRDMSLYACNYARGFKASTVYFDELDWFSYVGKLVRATVNLFISVFPLLCSRIKVLDVWALVKEI